jgi:hypothetical protein
MTTMFLNEAAALKRLSRKLYVTDEYGTTDEPGGWTGLFEQNIKPEEFYAFFPAHEFSMRYKTINAVTHMAGFIVTDDGKGKETYTMYTTTKQLQEAWDKTCKAIDRAEDAWLEDYDASDDMIDAGVL